jgi:hypothetical protein
VTLAGHEYVLWMRVRRPPRVGVYGMPRCAMHHVAVLVLLNMSL